MNEDTPEKKIKCCISECGDKNAYNLSQ